MAVNYVSVDVKNKNYILFGECELYDDYGECELYDDYEDVFSMIMLE